MACSCEGLGHRLMEAIEALIPTRTQMPRVGTGHLLDGNVMLTILDVTIFGVSKKSLRICLDQEMPNAKK